MTGLWTPEQEAFILANPADYEGFNARWPMHYERWRGKRRRLVAAQEKTLYRRPDQIPELGEVFWDKKVGNFHWTDVLDPLEEIQRISREASSSQDFATIRIETDKPVGVALISDWHIGSWGVSLREVARITNRIKQLGLRTMILGDMQEMAIRLRSIAEISGNLLVPGMQDGFLESWFSDFAKWTLLATWDNHAVQRQEELVGTSHYAEVFKKEVVYFPGLGHVDLQVGDEVYKIAVSHRFPGNTRTQPTGGQERYMRTEGIDREMAIAGDSHRPSMRVYTDGPLERWAINCGTLQQDSKYAKRYFSLYTHDWMPVVVFWPDRHMIVGYPSLDHYCAANSAL